MIVDGVKKEHILNFGHEVVSKLTFQKNVQDCTVAIRERSSFYPGRGDMVIEAVLNDTPISNDVGSFTSTELIIIYARSFDDPVNGTLRHG